MLIILMLIILMIRRKSLNKYRGFYNYYGELYKLWTMASSKGASHRNFILQLKKKLKISHYTLSCYFNGDRPNYEIKPMMNFSSKEAD